MRIQLPTSAGKHQLILRATATDEAGNTKSEEKTYTIIRFR